MLFLSAHSEVLGFLLNVLHALPNMFTAAYNADVTMIVIPKGISNNVKYLQIWFGSLLLLCANKQNFIRCFSIVSQKREFKIKGKIVVC